ncbi:MAG: hypothetical protein AB7E13_10605 [Arcobacteraceae bacterium]
MNLKRMQELLNKSANANQSTIAQDNETLQEIMNYEGYSIRFSGSSNQKEKFFKDCTTELKKAKGLYIKFICSESITASTVGTIIEDINYGLTNNTTIIMETAINENICPSECQFQILLTGLEKEG